MTKLSTTFIITAALLLPGSVQARYLSPDEALRNIDMRSAAGTKRAVAANTTNYRLVYSAVDNLSHQPTVYVFTRTQGEGFLVAAASDVIEPLLGYSDTDAGYGTQANPGFEYWLQCYSQAIAAAEANGTTVSSATAKASRSDIAPLIASRWNQDDPYNQECPVVGGSRSVTGCVATAYAQLMYYHKWPKTAGKGSKTYTWEVNGVEYTESMDFSTVTFDWGNMTNTYSSSSTTAQRTAVAKLMHAIGVGAEMGYTPQSSGAVSLLAAQSLLDNWDYDKGAQVKSRESFSTDAWADMIYAELSAKRPVIYDGQSSESGHCFVCDGYQSSTGYFHINWGWGGYCDGYFLLSDLTPQKGGIGGTTSDDGYNKMQSIVIGLQPNKGSSDYTYSMEITADLTPETASYDKTSWISIPGQYINSSLTDLTFAYGLKLADRTNPSNVQYVPYLPEQYFTDSSWRTLKPGYFYNGLSIYGMTIPAGSYTASFIFKTKNGEWKDMVYGPDIKGTFQIDANKDYVAINGAELPQQEKHLICNADMVAESNLNTLGTVLSFSGSFSNPSSSTIDFTPGLKFTDNRNPDQVYYYSYTSANWSLPSQYHYSKWYGIPSTDIPDGEYTVTPAYIDKSTNQWVDFDRNPNVKDYCTARINREYVALDCELPGEPLQMEEFAVTPATASDLDADGTLHYYTGHNYTTTFKVKPTGNRNDSWTSYIGLYLTDQDGNVSQVGSTTTASSTSTFPVEITATLTIDGNKLPGDYSLTLWRTNRNGTAKYSELGSVKFTTEFDPTASVLLVDEAGWSGKATISGTGTSQDPIILLSDNAKLRMVVHNYSQPHSKTYRLTIFGKNEGSSNFTGEAYANFTIECAAGETKEYVFDLLYDATKGTAYMSRDNAGASSDMTTVNTPLSFYSGHTSLDKDKLYMFYIKPTDDASKYLYPHTYFKIDSHLFTGVESVVATQEAAPRYFDLTGYEVTTPISGHLYIRIEGNKATKVLYK